MDKTRAGNMRVRVTNPHSSRVGQVGYMVDAFSRSELEGKPREPHERDVEVVVDFGDGPPESFHRDDVTVMM